MSIKSRYSCMRTMCSALALIAAPFPAFAQSGDGMPRNALEVLQRFEENGRIIDAQLRFAEEHRLAGNCPERASALKRVDDAIARLDALAKLVGGEMFNPQEKIADARARRKEIADAPCPPTDTEQPKTAQAATAAPPTSVMDEMDDKPPPARDPGQTRTLEDLQIEYAAASCGTDAEKAAARDRLLTALDRAIAIEKSPQKRDRLLEQRQRVADGTVGQKPCLKPAESKPTEVGRAGPPLTRDELDERSALRFSIVQDIEREFNLAERARLAGNCSYRDNVLGSLRSKLAKPKLQTGGPEDPNDPDVAVWDEWRSRLAEAEKRPCPPDAAPLPVGMLPSPGVSAEEYKDREAKLAQEIKDARRRRNDAFLAAYYAYNLLPFTAIGVTRAGPGAAEVDAGRTRRRINSLGVSAGFQTKIAADFDLRLRGDYGEGDAKITIAQPANAAGAPRDNGIVYGRLLNGSSGVIAGGAGNGATRTDLTDWGIKADIGHDFGKVRIGVGLSYDKVETKHDLSFASSIVSGGFTFNFGQERWQRLDEDFWGLYGSFDATLPICPDADLKLEIIGGPVRRNTRWEGIERDTANFGPVGNRDITTPFGDSQSSWGAYGKAGASVQYRIGSGASLIFGGSFEHRDEVGKVVVPNSGNQVFFEGQTQRLESDDANRWEVFFGTRFTF